MRTCNLFNSHLRNIRNQLSGQFLFSLCDSICYKGAWDASLLAKGHFRVPKTLSFKMRLGAQPFLWKWVFFAWEWKMISISKAEHLPSFWNRGSGELGNGLFNIVFYAFIIYIVAGFFLLADCWKLLFSKVSVLILESNSLFSY